MNPENVREGLIEILEEIQTVSGYECPDIKLDTKPVETLPGFDSLIYPTATVMLEEKLNIIIPNDVNIFYQDKALNIAEIVELVMTITSSQQENKMEELQHD